MKDDKKGPKGPKTLAVKNDTRWNVWTKYTNRRTDKEEQYVMYCYNIGEYPNIEDYNTAIQEKYKGISRDEAQKLDAIKY